MSSAPIKVKNSRAAKKKKRLGEATDLGHSQMSETDRWAKFQKAAQEIAWFHQSNFQVAPFAPELYVDKQLQQPPPPLLFSTTTVVTTTSSLRTDKHHHWLCHSPFFLLDSVLHIFFLLSTKNVDIFFNPQTLTSSQLGFAQRATLWRFFAKPRVCSHIRGKTWTWNPPYRRLCQEESRLFLMWFACLGSPCTKDLTQWLLVNGNQ